MALLAAPNEAEKHGSRSYRSRKFDLVGNVRVQILSAQKCDLNDGGYGHPISRACDVDCRPDARDRPANGSGQNGHSPCKECISCERQATADQRFHYGVHND